MNKEKFSAWLNIHTKISDSLREDYIAILDTWDVWQLEDIALFNEAIQQIDCDTKLKQQASYFYRLFLKGYPKQLRGTYTLPILQPSGRTREYLQHPDLLKGRILYEHLIKNQMHRWLDVNILGHNGNTNGRVSANILYYFGIKADYRGLFKDCTLPELIELLHEAGEGYEDVVRLLQMYADYLTVAEAQIAISDEELEADRESQDIENGIIKEGSMKYYYGSRYERSITNRKKAIEIHGVSCIGCGFVFEDKYGEHGKNYIEIHHIQPLYTLGKPEVINPATDLVPLCANCHRMVHRRYDSVLSVQQLKEIIEENRI